MSGFVRVSRYKKTLEEERVRTFPFWLVSRSGPFDPLLPPFAASFVDPGPIDFPKVLGRRDPVEPKAASVVKALEETQDPNEAQFSRIISGALYRGNELIQIAGQLIQPHEQVEALRADRVEGRFVELQVHPRLCDVDSSSVEDSYLILGWAHELIQVFPGLERLNEPGLGALALAHALHELLSAAQRWQQEQSRQP